MSYKEWITKYNKIVALAKELDKYPDCSGTNLTCNCCPVKNKYNVVTAIIALSHIN